ncbi:hypothetical protein [Massilia sp. Root351]|jgi:hypothetical protein|uniref:hypothetical protein n=1 Tax=Massilia sp. Root351 TaxID=1736522 RepID=UPI000B25FC32|nr:hypothetical protein [Massilia sp. Root351]
MPVDVITNEYAIGTLNDGDGVLHTQYIGTCTALVGRDAVSGTVFLCHLNTPRSILALPELVVQLRAMGLDLSNFQLYKLGGIHPMYMWLGSLPMAVLGWLWAHEPGFAAICALLPFLFALTRLSLRYQLWRTGAFTHRPRSLGYCRKRLGLGRTRVTVVASRKDLAPRVESYADDPRDDEFATWTYKWTKMRKAANSA